MKARAVLLKVASGIGAFIGYGCLAVFLYVIGTQIYQWFRDGEWTRIGMGDGMRDVLTRCCVNDGDSGKFANFLQWWESPATGLGLHKVLEVFPASMALFALSVIGNCLLIYCTDQLRSHRAGGGALGARSGEIDAS